MAELINTLNTADRLAESFFHSQIPLLILQERLINLGFYDVETEELPLTAKFNGVRYTFTRKEWK